MSTNENKITLAKNPLENNLNLDFNTKSAIAFKSHKFMVILFRCCGKSLDEPIYSEYKAGRRFMGPPLHGRRPDLHLWDLTA
jgi:hypothetical protein